MGPSHRAGAAPRAAAGHRSARPRWLATRAIARGLHGRRCGDPRAGLVLRGAVRFDRGDRPRTQAGLLPTRRRRARVAGVADAAQRRGAAQPRPGVAAGGDVPRRRRRARAALRRAGARPRRALGPAAPIASRLRGPCVLSPHRSPHPGRPRFMRSSTASLSALRSPPVGGGFTVLHLGVRRYRARPTQEAALLAAAWVAEDLATTRAAQTASAWAAWPGGRAAPHGPWPRAPRRASSWRTARTPAPFASCLPRGSRAPASRGSAQATRRCGIERKRPASTSPDSTRSRSTPSRPRPRGFLGVVDHGESP